MKTIIVIGAGIVGVSTAIWLQRSGFKVTIIDQKGPATGASHGNAGILAASYASFINKKCSDSIKISLPIGSVKVNIKENELEIIGVAEVSYLGEYNFV